MALCRFHQLEIHSHGRAAPFLSESNTLPAANMQWLFTCWHLHGWGLKHKMTESWDNKTSLAQGQSTPVGRGSSTFSAFILSGQRNREIFVFPGPWHPEGDRWAALFLPSLVNLKLLFLFHSCQHCFLKPISYSTYPSFSPGVHGLTTIPLRLTWNPLL